MLTIQKEINMNIPVYSFLLLLLIFLPIWIRHYDCCSIFGIIWLVLLCTQMRTDHFIEN